MGPADFTLHLLSFAAPALCMALLLPVAARFLMPKQAAARSYRTQAAINCIAGVLVLGAGLWYFGRDGKMATYAALAVVMATAQWLSLRAWRG
jgi:ABC-type nickel/cobalt efflux system permease component RcnA